MALGVPMGGAGTPRTKAMMQREEILRRLPLGDAPCLEVLTDSRRTRPGGSGLGGTGEALVRIGALAAIDAPDLVWQMAVESAMNAGLTPDEIVDALVVLAPVIGQTRVFAIAPKIALAVGCDVDAMLEHESRDRPRAPIAAGPTADTTSTPAV
jgi:4-carboxymuconolactone decarboxylase